MTNSVSIAGLDVLAGSEQATEHLLNTLATWLADLGAAEITTATHRATVFSTPHVAASIALTSPTDAAAWHAQLAEQLAVSTTGPFAVWMGQTGVGQPALQDSARQAAAEHRDRSDGRVVHFPGRQSLTGTVTVADALATAIDRVDAVGGGRPGTRDRLITRDFVRPRWQAGQLILHVQPAVGGTWVPFETPNPTPCCPAHS